MYSDENLFGVSFISSLDCVSSFVVVIMGAEFYEVSEVRVTISFSMSFDEKQLFLLMALWYPMRGGVSMI